MNVPTGMGTSWSVDLYILISMSLMQKEASLMRGESYTQLWVLTQKLEILLVYADGNSRCSSTFHNLTSQLCLQRQALIPTDQDGIKSNQVAVRWSWYRRPVIAPFARP